MYREREELDAEIRDDDLKIDEARRNGRLVKCIAVRCMASKTLFAHVVPVKGYDEEHYVAKLIVADIEWLGHTKVILKSNNERSLLALRKRVARLLKMNESFVNVQEENPVAYDSQSNGSIEVGISIVRGLYRTLKLCLEARIGKCLPAAHPISAWLLQHTCVLLNARSVGSDGQTAWQRVKGRMFRQLLLCFGECVLYKLPSKGKDSKPDGNMGTKWLEGVFLGFSRSSISYLVGTSDGVVTARSVYRRPMDVRWSFDRLLELKATPWSRREKPNLEVRFSETGAAPERRARDEIPLPRAFRITYGDLVEHGFTVECPQCMYNEQNQRSKPGISHSNICRQRLLDALLSIPAGRRRFEAYEEKIDQAIADRGPEYEWRPGGAGSGRAAAMGADGSGVARHGTDPVQP